MKNKVPKLRFKEFSSEWKEQRLGKIGNIVTGSTPETSKTEYYDGEYLFVSPIDIKSNRYIKNTKTTLTELGFNKGRKIPKMSICFVCIGSTIGKVAQVLEECITNQQINSIIPFKDISNNFIYSCLENKSDKIKLLAGEQAVPLINKSDFSKINIFIPTFPEQEKIGNFLSSVDIKIDKLEKKKELLEKYKKGMMQKLFSQKLRFKDENGNDYPEWEEKKLGDIGDIISGLTYSPNDIVKKGLLVLRSSNVQDRTLKFEDNVYVDVDTYNPVKENDILICVRNGSKQLIGKNALITKENEGLAFGAFMSVFRSSINKFVFQYFDTFKYKKKIYTNLGATINSINGSDLKKFEIDIPSLPEQKKIANFLSSIDKKIELVEQELEKNKEFKKGLLQQMFV